MSPATVGPLLATRSDAALLRTDTLEYPVRTMNYRPENSSFQVDTGPLLVPDFGKASSAPSIDELEMAARFRAATWNR